MATLLSIVQDICDELSIRQPSTVIGNTAGEIRTVLRMCNREGRSLVTEHDWTILQKLHTITTVASTASYALPSDYSRLIPQTEWDRTGAEPMSGPTSPIEWQVLKSGNIGSGVVNRRFRIFRDSSDVVRKVYIDPTPDTSSETLVFEYISDEWCAASGGTGQTEWGDDTDVNILDEDLLILGTVVRFKRSKGFDFASEAQEYTDMLAEKKAQDRPAKVLNMAGRKGDVHLLGFPNMPETGFG